MPRVREIALFRGRVGDWGVRVRVLSAMLPVGAFGREGEEGHAGGGETSEGFHGLLGRANALVKKSAMSRMQFRSSVRDGTVCPRW